MSTASPSAKILRLTSENIKRLSAVEITPEGNVIVIGGRNGQGKSSVLDSIEYALAGAASHPVKPIREGKRSGFVEIDLGDLIVKRTFTASGTTLVVSNKEGAVFKSPQNMMDALVGKLSFDPLGFARSSAENQAEILRKLVGLDFAEMEANRSALYGERTTVNRDAKLLQGQLAAMPGHTGLPKEEVAVEAIAAEMQAAMLVNKANAAKRGDFKTATKMLERDVAEHESACARCKAVEKQIEELKTRLASLESHRDGLQRAISEAILRVNAEKVEVGAITDIEMTTFQVRIIEARDTNNKIQENVRRNQLEADMLTKQKRSDEITAKIDALDNEKTKKVAESKFPVAGLSMDDDGAVTFNGIPFSQASSAEQLRVSVAIGIALNPKLRVLLIRDGSLLDQDSLKLLTDMAIEHDAQVWLERVSDGKEVTVVIEDGTVLKRDEPEPQEVGNVP